MDTLSNNTFSSFVPQPSVVTNPTQLESDKKGTERNSIDIDKADLKIEIANQQDQSQNDQTTIDQKII